jgi:magnesium-transporting ATPase (P-type)
VPLEEFLQAVNEAQQESMKQGGRGMAASSPIESVAQELGTDIEHGLTEGQVMDMRAKYGVNVLERSRQEPWWKIFIKQYLSPVVLLLLAAAVVGILTGMHVQ